jgi:hypothetical protein
VGLAILRSPKSVDHAFDGCMGRHFPFFMPSDSVRNGEHPPVRPSLRGSRRDHVAQTVFIVIANAPNIGSFHEF